MAAPSVGPDLLPLPLPQHFHPLTVFQLLALPLLQRDGGHLLPDLPQDGLFRLFSVGDMPPTAIS